MARPNPSDIVQAPQYEEGVSIQNTYDLDPGVCVLPIAEDPPTSQGELQTWSPVVILRLHAPYRVRNTSYDALKSHAPPIMPRPGDTGKFVFVGGSLTAVNVLNQSYGSFDWAVSAQYSFVENCVSRTQDGFVLGSPPWPWLSSVVASNSFPPTNNNGIGAISQAGTDAQIGLTMAQTVPSLTQPLNIGLGAVVQPATYIYTIPSYLPGVFFSADLVDGGTGSSVPDNTDLWSM